MKNKFLITFSLIILILFIFCTSCFATDVDLNGGTYTLNDEIAEFKYILTMYSTSSRYAWIIVSNSEFIFTNPTTRSDGKTCYHVQTIDNSPFYYKMIYYESLSNIPNYGLSSFTKVSESLSSNQTCIEFITYSSFDLKNTDGNVLFQGAPQPEGQTMSTIATKITSVDFSMVMSEVLTILPIVLLIVIGLLALRKAIQLLLRTLRRLLVIYSKTYLVFLNF